MATAILPQQSPAEAAAPEDRAPDIVRSVISWIDAEPQITAVMARNGEPKFSRRARVQGKAQEVEITVLATVKQWQYANGSVEGYLSKDAKLIYWRPAISSASPASDFV